MKVAVLDDDIDDLYLISQALERLPNIHFTADQNAEEFLQSLTKLDLDLLLLDLNMPKFSGYDVIKQIKFIRPLLPVVVFTTSNNVRDCEQSMLLGAHGYFVKPGEYEQLKLILANIVTYWQQTCAIQERYPDESI